MFRKIFCAHEYQKHTFTRVRCLKCGKDKFNEKLAAKLMEEFFRERINSGFWTKEEVNKSLMQSPSANFLID